LPAFRGRKLAAEAVSTALRFVKRVAQGRELCPRRFLFARSLDHASKVLISADERPEPAIDAQIFLAGSLGMAGRLPKPVSRCLRLASAGILEALSRRNLTITGMIRADEWSDPDIDGGSKAAGRQTMAIGGESQDVWTMGAATRP
jgi:hypothetical protein